MEKAKHVTWRLLVCRCLSADGQQRGASRLHWMSSVAVTRKSTSMG
ncbi:hypothetical protein ACVXHB_23230 [Escherichia coli]